MSGATALTSLLSFPHGLLYGSLDAELTGPEPRDAAFRDGFQHDGVDAQAGCVVVLGNAGCRGGLSYKKGQGAEFQGFHLLSVLARNSKAEAPPNTVIFPSALSPSLSRGQRQQQNRKGRPAA